MSTTFFQLAFDAANAADQAEFWAQATCHGGLSRGPST
jgi:hypothetical protein